MAYIKLTFFLKTIAIRKRTKKADWEERMKAEKDEFKGKEKLDKVSGRPLIKYL